MNDKQQLYMKEVIQSAKNEVTRHTLAEANARDFYEKLRSSVCKDSANMLVGVLQIVYDKLIELGKEEEANEQETCDVHPV